MEDTSGAASAGDVGERHRRELGMLGRGRGTEAGAGAKSVLVTEAGLDDSTPFTTPFMLVWSSSRSCRCLEGER